MTATNVKESLRYLCEAEMAYTLMANMAASQSVRLGGSQSSGAIIDSLGGTITPNAWEVDTNIIPAQHLNKVNPYE
jgi:sulfur carrier protein ThiS